MHHFLFLLISVFNLVTSFAQLKPSKKWQIVLNENHQDSTFHFDNSKGGKFDETMLTYLGQVTTKKGRTFKIIKSCWIWSESAHTTGRIIFFNEKNQYLGEYHVGGLLDLPEKLEESRLVFTNTQKEECDKHLKTFVELKNGIPKTIFINCKDKYGDIHPFTFE